MGLHISVNVKKVVITYDDEVVERLFNGHEKIKSKRYKGYVVDDVAVISSHIGPTNMAIVVDDLVKDGVKEIIHVGTFGSLREEIRVNDYLIPAGAIRMEGVSEAYLPVNFPSVPTPGLLAKVEEFFNKRDLSVKKGIIWSASVYRPITDRFSWNKLYDIYFWSKFAHGVEMETATFYTQAWFHKIEGVSLLMCNRDWKTIKAYLEGNEVEWYSKKDTKKFEDLIKYSIEILR